MKNFSIKQNLELSFTNPQKKPDLIVFNLDYFNMFDKKEDALLKKYAIKVKGMTPLLRFFFKRNVKAKLTLNDSRFKWNYQKFINHVFINNLIKLEIMVVRSSKKAKNKGVAKEQYVFKKTYLWSKRRISRTTRIVKMISSTGLERALALRFSRVFLDIYFEKKHAYFHEFINRIISNIIRS